MYENYLEKTVPHVLYGISLLLSLLPNILPNPTHRLVAYKCLLNE